MSAVNSPTVKRCILLSSEIINWQIAVDYRGILRTEILNGRERLKYQSCVNKHYAMVELSNQAYRLLKQSAEELRKIDHLIKTTKAKRNKYRKRGNFTKSDQLTALIKSLSGIYFELRKNRNDCLVKSRELNENVAQLRDYIHYNCGSSGQLWYEKFQNRKNKNLSNNQD